MKTAVALITFSIGAFSTLGAISNLSAAEGQADRLQQDQPAKRVASVNWNIQTGKLEWVVQDGVERNGEFVPSGQEEHYEITPEEAKMAVQGQQRGFTSQEADWLQGLLHVLTVYCAESTVWWEQGQGLKLDDHGKPLDNAQPSGPPPDQPDLDTSPHKVLNPPQRRVPGSIQLVALRMIQ